MWEGRKEGVPNSGAAGADFQAQCSPRPVHHDNEPQIELGRCSRTDLVIRLWLPG